MTKISNAVSSPISVPDKKSDRVMQLSQEASDLIDQIAKSRGGITREEAVRFALSDESFFLEATKAGHRIFIERSRPLFKNNIGNLSEINLLARR